MNVAFQKKDFMEKWLIQYKNRKYALDTCGHPMRALGINGKCLLSHLFNEDGGLRAGKCKVRSCKDCKGKAGEVDLIAPSRLQHWTFYGIATED